MSRKERYLTRLQSGGVGVRQQKRENATGGRYDSPGMGGLILSRDPGDGRATSRE